MEPFEIEKLTDDELDNLLPEWKTPSAPDRIRRSLFSSPAEPWFRRLWTASIRVPLPVAVGLILVLGFVATHRPAPPAPPVVVRTERVEVPNVQERVVTKFVYQRPPARSPVTLTFRELQPVDELRPRILRSSYAEN